MLAKYALPTVVQVAFVSLTEVLNQTTGEINPFNFHNVLDMAESVTKFSLEIMPQDKYPAMYVDCFILQDPKNPTFPVPLEIMTPITTITLTEVIRHVYITTKTMLGDINTEKEFNAALCVIVDKCVSAIHDAENNLYSDNYMQAFGNPYAIWN